MQQALDFVAESETLAELLEDLPNTDWDRPTQFKGWTVNDVIVHLHFWNLGADMSLTDPNGFEQHLQKAMVGLQGGMRAMENTEINERGPELFALWQTLYRDMGARWAQVDPKTRVKWAGPDMSARSSMTARQMETWAHGQEVFDLLGVTRQETDRIRNIVVLGVNTFDWSHDVQGFPIPDAMPHLCLTAPSGEMWTYGDAEAGQIIGSAVGFAQVVTQVRNVADTDLQMTGEVAERWMQTAQCFAGDRETPPDPGTRFTTC